MNKVKTTCERRESRGIRSSRSRLKRIKLYALKWIGKTQDRITSYETLKDHIYVCNFVSLCLLSSAEAFNGVSEILVVFLHVQDAQ